MAGDETGDCSQGSNGERNLKDRNRNRIKMDRNVWMDEKRVVNVE